MEEETRSTKSPKNTSGYYFRPIKDEGFQESKIHFQYSVLKMYFRVKPSKFKKSIKKA
jgi:hypothetical protein